MPSGAAMIFMRVMDLQPYSLTKVMAATALPPVASMGSTMNTWRSAISLGILQ